MSALNVPQRLGRIIWKLKEIPCGINECKNMHIFMRLT
jgi:hypothetical protein